MDTFGLFWCSLWALFAQLKHVCLVSFIYIARAAPSSKKKPRKVYRLLFKRSIRVFLNETRQLTARSASWPVSQDSSRTGFTAAAEDTGWDQRAQVLWDGA
jgi:hypothetical protein